MGRGTSGAGALMLVHPWDAAIDPDEWRDFVVTQGFGQLIASGRDREVPIVVPTQFVLDGDIVWLHLARPNPVWGAIDERPVVLLSIAGDWAYVPSAWKAVGDEDPAEGVPTTYYAAAQLTCDVTVIDDDEGKLAILRRQLAAVEPELAAADPSVHLRKLPGIRGLRLVVREVRAKFKYGGNVDREHRRFVAEHLAARGGPGDASALEQLLRRTAAAGD
jgi:transcriptional regulator